MGYYLEGEEDWWAICWNAAFRAFLDQLNEDDLLSFKKIHLENISKMKNEKGLWLEVDILFTLVQMDIN